MILSDLCINCMVALMAAYRYEFMVKVAAGKNDLLHFVYKNK